MLDFDLLWIPILVGALANMVLGFLWYSMPVLGRPWMRETGKTMEQIKQGSKPILYVGAMVAALVSSFGIGLVLENAAVASLTDAIVLAVLLWLALFATPTFANFSFEGRSWLLFLIYASYQLVAFLLMAGIYYAWPVTA